ncbi:hypothetical protein DPV78_001146 [Talaromyces pinophilus]|nr:hypothetical protein DPV78_001146 [Talaromyces pinophilus]
MARTSQEREATREYTHRSVSRSSYISMDHNVNEYLYGDAINLFGGGRPSFIREASLKRFNDADSNLTSGASMELFGYWENFEYIDVMCHPMPQDN